MISFKKAYKFPLHVDKNRTYIWTNDYTMAFNYLIDNADYIKQIIRKINGKDVPELDCSKPFSIAGSLKIQDKFGNKLLLLRGWGHLTGVGGLNLEPEEAMDIQDEFLKYCVNQLNK